MLEIEGIDVFYGDMQALRRVSLEVRAAEMVALIGSNGAGKSTTLRSISGLLRPRSGSIRFHGQDICRMSPAGIVELGVSQVPEGRQIFPNMTVQENLEMGAQFPKVKKVRSQTLEQVFGLFPRLRERISQKAGTLSGGEQQMLAIGRGLMSRPRLLMLDEPSLGLSPLLVSLIFETIDKINQGGTMVLLVEQNVFHALKISRRGYVLENGSVLMEGEGEGLLRDDHIRKAYLGL
jgi:branched-chain amino acid transport system ATP-binding protein